MEESRESNTGESKTEESENESHGIQALHSFGTATQRVLGDHVSRVRPFLLAFDETEEPHLPPVLSPTKKVKTGDDGVMDADIHS